MKDLLAFTGATAFGLVLFLLVVAGATFGGIAIYKYAGPLQQDIRREVFEGTKSFNDGTVRDLSNLRNEYLGAGNDAHRAALRSTILHRASDIDEDRLPGDLRSFIRDLRS